MGRFDDITMEELQELREQTEGEIPRERVLAAIGRKQGDQIDTLAERYGVVERTIIYWLPTTNHVQAGPRNSTMMNANSCSRTSRTHPPNSATNNRRGHPSCCSCTSKTRTMSNTARDTLASCWARPGCPVGQRDRVTTKPTPRRRPSFSRRSKKTTGADRENRRRCRSVHQTCWYGQPAWLVPDWLRSNDRGFELLGQGDSAWRCHRRR